MRIYAKGTTHMKKVILNLYQRDYLTFFLIAYFLDVISLMIFKFPIIFLAIALTQITISTVMIFKRYKK